MTVRIHCTCETPTIYVFPSGKPICTMCGNPLAPVTAPLKARP